MSHDFPPPPSLSLSSPASISTTPPPTPFALHSQSPLHHNNGNYLSDRHCLSALTSGELCPSEDSRNLLRRRVADRPRYLLRRQRRLRNHGGRVRVRQPVQPGVRREQRGAEHGALQQRLELRRVLRDQVHQRAELEVLPSGQPVHLHNRHELLPAQFRPTKRQRRLVQPSTLAFRSRDADVPPARRVPRRHCPRLLPPGSLQEEGGNQIHNQRFPLLQPGAGHERRRRRRRRQSVGERREDRVDSDESELGAELGNQRSVGRTVAVVPSEVKRSSRFHFLEHRPC